MYSAFNPPPWSLLQRHPPTAQSFLIHIKLPYLHNESPRQLKCNVLCLFTQWLCGWNACWASTTTSLTWNNKNTSTSSNSKSFKTKVKIYRLIPPLLHQLTVSRTHDASDPCSALLGYFLTKNDCRHWKHYNTHRNKLIPQVLHRPMIYRKKYGINGKTHSSAHYCPICDLSAIRTLFVNSHEQIQVWLMAMVFCVNVKIHLQPEYWDKQITVTNLHTRIDSYL